VSYVPASRYGSVVNCFFRSSDSGVPENTMFAKLTMFAACDGFRECPPPSM
jgi:hypothetical protein